MKPRSGAISPAEYETLAEFRRQIAAFLRRRRKAAEEAGLQPQQYELLLAIKGMPDGVQPNIKHLAEQLRLQHHSAVELTGRLEKRGLVLRQRSPRDRRSVLVSVTKAGDQVLEEVVRYSLVQLQSEGPELVKTLGQLVKAKRKPR